MFTNISLREGLLKLLLMLLFNLFFKWSHSFSGLEFRNLLYVGVFQL